LAIKKKTKKTVVKNPHVGRPPERGGERGVQFCVYFPRSFLGEFTEAVKNEGKNRTDVLYELATQYMSIPRPRQK